MNGIRYEGSLSPEGRLAAIVMEILHSMEEKNRKTGQSDIVDYADLEVRLRPYVQKELRHAQLEEIRKIRTESRNRMVSREETIYNELAQLEHQISHLRGTS